VSVELGSGRWRDEVNGLTVVRASPNELYRVFNSSHTALSPLIPDGDKSTWTRFDVEDHATLYLAEDKLGAICEVLAYAKSQPLNLDRIFPDVSERDDPVADEWAALGFEDPALIVQSWLKNREVTTLTIFPGVTNWFVDILAADSIGVLRRYARQWSPDASLVQDTLKIDISLLTGPKREITVAAAAWLRNRTLEDGSKPDGILYSSKHGVNLLCWAIWIPLGGEKKQELVSDLVRRTVTESPRGNHSIDDISIQRAKQILDLSNTNEDLEEN